MYCPNCGKADQALNTYCRQCGEFLPDHSIKKRSFTMGGDTPEQQIRTNLILNFISGMVSLVLAILLYATFWNNPETSQIIYLVAAFLLAMCGWQFSTFRVGLKLKKTFDKRKKAGKSEEALPKTTNSFEAAKTKIMLDKANLADVVPASVTENTTRQLGEKVLLSQTEKQSDR